MLTGNEQVLIKTKKENYILSIQLVHISAAKLSGIMVIALGIVLVTVHFSIEGDVIEGPADQPLKRVDNE